MPTCFKNIVLITLCCFCTFGKANMEPSDFRNLLYGSLDGMPGKEVPAYLDYLPDRELIESPEVKTAEAFLAELKARYSSIRPSDLFRRGLKIPLEPFASRDLSRLLQTKTITFVMIPGLFSEFPKGKALDEIFSNSKSNYSKEWEKKFGENPITDEAFSLSKMKNFPIGLDKLVRAASIESVEGTTLLKIIRLDSPRMSLESLGDIRTSADIYIRRLNKFFDCMGVPETLVLVGHSRGAATVLEMLSRSVSKPSWFEKVRGMISLAGITYGTELVDASKIEGTLPFLQIEPWRFLKRKLEPLDGVDVPSLKVNLDSARALLSFGKKLSGPQMNSDLVSAMLSDLGPNEVPNGTTLIRTLFGEFNPVETRANIQRYLKFASSMLVSLDELGTVGRQQWWRTHEVPSAGIHYYALPATMVSEDEDKDLATNSFTYNDKLFEYRILQGAYQLFREVTGTRLNDSHVEVERVVFWPKLNAMLNSKQQKMETTFLGILGTHHWSPVLRRINNRFEAGEDPFPRVALFKALAAAVIFDMQ